MPDQIEWPNCKITFTKVEATYWYSMDPFGERESLPLYEAVLEYEDAGGKRARVNLSQTTQTKPCYFTGTRNGFYAHDPRTYDTDENFYVVGIQPEELARDQRRMASVDHELGHALIMDADSDTNLLRGAISNNPNILPRYLGIKNYADALAEVVPDKLRDMDIKDIGKRTLAQARGRDVRIRREVSLFHERYAWAAAMKLAERRGSPTGFKDPSSVMEYAKFCLLTYADHYRDPRFVKGLRER